MALSKISEILSLDSKDIEKEILAARKNLFKLRFKQATTKSFKSHSFSHIKHRLRQLLMVQGKTE